MTETIATVVGKNARAIRLSAGLTIEGLVQEARKNGLRWSAGRISHIERGDQTLSVDTLLMLANLLTAATDQEVRPVDLLRTDEDVQLSWEPAVTGAGLRKMFTGEDGGFSVLMTPGGSSRVAHMLEAVRASSARMSAAAGGSLTYGQMEDLSTAASPADRRHAEKLGLDSSEYLGWCYRLWGHPLSQETERRAPAGATPQKKGRITRELLDELRQRIAEDQRHGDG